MYSVIVYQGKKEKKKLLVIGVATTESSLPVWEPGAVIAASPPLSPWIIVIKKNFIIHKE